MNTRPAVPQRDHDRTFARVRLFFTVFAAALLFCWLAGGARGADRWMSAPSYYSHHVPPHLVPFHPRPVSREAYRPAWVGNRPGFSVSGATRLNRVQFRIGGGTDTTLLYSERAQFGP